MADLDDDLDFDFDTDMDDLDIDPFSPNNEEVQDDRSPITRVGASALKSVLTESTARTVAKSLRDHALPEGYRQAAYAADDAIGAAKELYDSAAKELEPAKKSVQKLIRENESRIDSALPEWLAKRVKGMGGRADEERDYIDPQEAEIQASLGGIFDQYKQAQQQTVETTAIEAQREEGESLKREAQHKEQVGLQSGIEAGVSRLVGYQDTVLVDYQRKNLELQHRQFFALRDMLVLARAGWTDQKTLLEAINKNVGLPDIVKLRVNENYGQMVENQILGDMQGSIHDYGMNLTKGIRKNIMDKVKGKAQALNDGVTGLVDMVGMISGSGMEEMGLSKEDLVGQMLADAGVGKLGQWGGKKLGTFLDKHERVAEGSERLMYYSKNFPDLVNEWAKSGATFGDNAFTDWIQNAIKEVIPTFSEDFGITADLQTNALDAMQFDRLTHRSIVEVIPGYLSRILQQVTAFNTGEMGERTVYDVGSEQFMSTGEQDRKFIKRLADKDTVDDKRKRVGGMIDSIAGSDTLSPAARKALEEQILTDRARGHTAFAPDRYKQTSWWDNEDAAEELSSFFHEANISWKDMNRLSGEMGRVGDSNRDIRQLIHDANKVGDVDVLRRLGLLQSDNTVDYGRVEAINREGQTLYDDQPTPPKPILRETTSPGRKLWNDAVGKTDLPPIGDVSAQVPTTYEVNLDMEGLSTLLETHRAQQRAEWETLFQTDGDGVQRLPVMVNPTDGAVDGPDIDASQTIVDTINENSATTHLLLQGISEAILNGSEGSGGLNLSAGGLLGSLRSGAGKLKDMLGAYYGGLGRIGKATLKTAGSVGSRALGSARRMTSKDVYVKGREFPALRADLMRQGFYYDAVSEAPIKTLDDALKAEGDIMDRNGNVALSVADRELGIEDRFGFDLGGIVDTVTSPFKAAWGWQMNILNAAASIPGKVSGAVRDKLQSVRDVYVKGESKPRLKAAILKNGGYFSAMTGEPIYSLDEINGDIVDMYGNLVLSMSDMQNGLVDRFGIDMDVKGIVGLIGDTATRAVKGGFGLLKQGYKTTFGLAGKGLSKAKDLTGSAVDWLRGKRNQAQDLYSDISGQAMDELEKVQSYMQEQGWTWGELSQMSVDDLKELMPDINWDELKITGGDQLRSMMGRVAPLMQSMGRGLSSLSMPDMSGIATGLTSNSRVMEEQLAVQRAIYEHLTGNAWTSPVVDETPAPGQLLDASGRPIVDERDITRAQSTLGDGWNTLRDKTSTAADRLQSATEEVIGDLDAKTADSREAIMARIEAARARMEALKTEASEQATETLGEVQGRVDRARELLNEQLEKRSGWGDKVKKGALVAGGLAAATAVGGPAVPALAAGYGLYRGGRWLKDTIPKLMERPEIKEGTLRHRLYTWGKRMSGQEEPDELATLHGTAGDRYTPGDEGEEDEGPLGDEIETGDDVASDVSVKGYMSAQLHTLRKLLPEKVRGDTDGDGHRDGSWQEYFNKDDDSGNTGPISVKVEKDEEEEEGWLGKLLSGVGGILMGGLSTLKDIIWGALMAKFGKDALSTGADVLGDVGDVADAPDRKGKPKPGKPKPGGPKKGLFRRGIGKLAEWGGRGLKAAKGLAGRALLSGKGLAVRGGMMLAGTKAGAATLALGAKAAGALAAGAGTVASAAGAAAAAIAAAPAALVIGAVVATAAVGYGVYKAFDYFGGRAAAEPLEGLRFLQYGVELNDKSFMSEIRDIEDEVMDNIDWQGKIPVLTEKPKYFLEEFGEDMGVDMTREDHQLQWLTWFQRRFAPVFLTHLSVVHALDPDVDLLDIDDELDDELKIEFIKRVQFGQRDIANKNWPYGVTGSPHPGEYLLSMEAEVKEYSTRLIAMLEKDGDADDFDWMPPPVTADDKKAMAVEREKELARMQNQSRGFNDVKQDHVVGTPMGTAKPTPSLPGDQETPPAENATAPQSGATTTVTPANNSGSAVDGAQAITGETNAVWTEMNGPFMVPTVGRLSSPYGYRQHPNGSGKKFHNGIDIAAPAGTPVVAAADGVIYRHYRSDSYGNVVYIKHPDGTGTRYAHMRSFEPHQGVGTAVKKGQRIGYVGNTGRSFGNHLHFEHRANLDQDAPTLDPMASFSTPVKKEADKMVAEAERSAKEEAKPDDNTLEGFDTTRNAVDPALVEDRKMGVKPADTTAAIAAAEGTAGLPPSMQHALGASANTASAAATPTPSVDLSKMDAVVDTQVKVGTEAARQRQRQLELAEEQAELTRQLLAAYNQGGRERAVESANQRGQGEFFKGETSSGGSNQPPRERQPKAVNGVVDLAH